MTKRKILSIGSTCNPKNKYLNNRILNKFDFMHKKVICVYMYICMHEYLIDEKKLDL